MFISEQNSLSWYILVWKSSSQEDNVIWQMMEQILGRSQLSWEKLHSAPPVVWARNNAEEEQPTFPRPGQCLSWSEAGRKNEMPTVFNAHNQRPILRRVVTILTCRVTTNGQESEGWPLARLFHGNVHISEYSVTMAGILQNVFSKGMYTLKDPENVSKIKTLVNHSALYFGLIVYTAIGAKVKQSR